MRAAGLTSLIDSTVAFATAFGLEAVVFSRQAWAQIPAGIVLAMTILLITWCVWTMREHGGVLGRLRRLKNCIFGSTEDLPNDVPDSGSIASNGEGGDGRSENGEAPPIWDLGSFQFSPAKTKSFNALDTSQSQPDGEQHLAWSAG
jgi:hypothetical protein